MSSKAKYIVCSLLDYLLTFGGTAGVIIYNYVSPANSAGVKISLTGIVLIIALLLTGKAMFEKNYQNKYNTLLQQLAEAADKDIKEGISKQIEAHKIKNNIYQRITMLLPFIILYIVTLLGAEMLNVLGGTVGLILLSMGAGSIFNIVKKPYKEKAMLNKTIQKTKR